MKRQTILIIILIIVLQSFWVSYLIEKNTKVTIIEKQDQIVIEEEDLMESILESIKKCIFSVEVLSKKTNAFAITSDGFLITLNSNIPQGNDFSFSNGKLLNYEVKKRDADSNLALVYTGEDLKTNCFGSLEEVKLGDKVYILGKDENDDYIFNQGKIRSISDLISTTIKEEEFLNGAPVFNHKGEILGIAEIKDGQVYIISIKKIKEFSNL